MKTAIALSVLLACSSSFAGEILRGTCSGQTTSGKDVTIGFCVKRTGGTALVACSSDGKGPVEVEVIKSAPDTGQERKVLSVKYSAITTQVADTFVCSAYDVPQRNIADGDAGRVTIDAVAGGASSFSVLMGPGWRFSFTSAQCWFDEFMNSP